MTARRHLRLLVIAALLGCAAPVGAQAALRYDTVTVEQRVLLTDDVSPAAARRKAIEEALAEAVRRVSGVRVRSGTLVVREEKDGRVSDDFLSVVQLDAAGRATDYRVLDEALVTTHHPELGDQVYLRLVVRATVATELLAPDPGFRLELSAASTTLRVRGRDPAGNDELVLQARASQAAHLTLFAVEGDSARRLFPNEYVPDVALAGGQATEVPAAEWRTRGLRLRAELPAGVDARRELVVGVATRDPAPPWAGATAMDLQRWLVAIPADRRAMQWVVIETRRQ